MKDFNQYSQRILLVTTGMSPQIVTETLYKLAVDSEAPFIPTQVQLITTLEGADKAKRALLADNGGENWLGRFCEDYAIEGLQFKEEHIHIIADTEGAFIDDSQCTEHNRASADFITQKILELTQDNDSALHVSLAGGRKTMSFYTGYALSLYGREQDYLSHVLVNESFQNNPEFYYPTPTQTEAKIILSEIPYVRMRYQVPNKLLTGKVGFQETVNTIQRFFQPETIVCYKTDKTVGFNGLEVEFSSANFAFYLWMCKRKLNDDPALNLEADSFMDEYLDIYKLYVGEDSSSFEKVQKIAINGDINKQKRWFEPNKSRVNSVIKENLGEKFAEAFLIKNYQLEDGNAFGLAVPKERIKINFGNP